MQRLTRHEQTRAKYRRMARRPRGREARIDRDMVDGLLSMTVDDAAVRQAAVQALCPCHVQANVKRVWDRLIELVDDPDVKVRGIVLHTLCDGSPRDREAEVVQALEQMYNDPDPKLRRRVRHLLASYRRIGKIKPFTALPCAAQRARFREDGPNQGRKVLRRTVIISRITASPSCSSTASATQPRR